MFPDIELSLVTDAGRSMSGTLDACFKTIGLRKEAQTMIGERGGPRRSFLFLGRTNSTYASIRVGGIQGALSDVSIVGTAAMIEISLWRGTAGMEWETGQWLHE